MASRNSQKLINYLGTETSVKLVDGSYKNVFVGGKGNDKAVPAGSALLSSVNTNPSSVNISEYHAARTFLKKNGYGEKLAKTYALLLTDVAKIKNVSIYELLKSVGDVVDLSAEELAIINQYRSKNTQESKLTLLDNSKSFKARNILA